jgi:hypothetical protein
MKIKITDCCSSKRALIQLFLQRVLKDRDCEFINEKVDYLPDDAIDYLLWNFKNDEIEWED